MYPQRLFYIVFITILLIRIFAALFFPLTGDEALFYNWGKYVAYGYYDHPPVSGWISALLFNINDSLFFFRLPAIVLPGVISWMIIKFNSSPENLGGYFAASLYLLLPINLLSIYTNDTPLIFFVMLSAFFIYRAMLTENLVHWMLGGVFLGLAFLTKYLVVILFVSYVVYFAFFQRKYIYSFLFSLICALPFVIFNVTYNYFNCWNNVMFNVINRNSNLYFSIWNPLLYILSIIYFVPPYILWKYVQAPLSANTAFYDKISKYSLVLLVVPLFFLGLISLEKRVGLHWILPFVPLLFVVVGQVFSLSILRKSVLYSIAFLLLNLTVFSMYLVVASKSEGKSFYFHSEQILNKVKNDSFVLMTESYSKSMVLSYYYQKYIPVFGLGSRYGRQDDMVVNFSTIAGKNIRILTNEKPNVSHYQPFFTRVEKHFVIVGSHHYWFIDGYQFQYKTYEKNVLQLIIKNYYQFPDWLTIGVCQFKSNIKERDEGIKKGALSG